MSVTVQRIEVGYEYGCAKCGRWFRVFQNFMHHECVGNP